ncbi:MAG: aspartyl protease family protein [Flavobacteriaceae bacterium]
MANAVPLTLPLQLTKSKHLICQLFVNGISGWFLIDTGASNSCLDEKCSDKFLVARQGKELPLTGAGKEKLSAFESQQSTVGTQEKVFAHLVFMLIDMETINMALIDQGNDPIDGIIGADLLRDKKAIIDYQHSRLQLPNALP